MAFSLPVSWYGTKYNSFRWLEERLPYTKRWLDAFGGSGIVTARRSPVEVEVYNDLNDHLANVFRVVRRHPEELQRTLRTIPFGRQSWLEAREKFDDEYLTDIERAAWFFAASDIVRTEVTPSSASDGRISRCKNRLRDPSAYANRVDQIEELSDRFRTVQVENRDAMSLIEWFDGDDAVFYCDPPYHHNTRKSSDNYSEESSEELHEELSRVASEVEGFVAISGYASDLYKDLFDGWNWYSRDETMTMGEYNKEIERTEVLWTNYDAEEIGGLTVGDWSEDPDLSLEEARESLV